MSSHVASELLTPLYIAGSLTAMSDEQPSKLPRSSNLPYKMAQVAS